MGKWYENAVFYHMYPIGMTGAPRRNESEETVHRFQDLMKWLPHIKDLGCTAIYIGPLFESTSHGYDTKDYRMVDRRLGDNQDFKGFVEKAHEMDIRVVVDGVFNHTGREFFAFQDIQKNREQSQYCGWYKGINFGWNSPYNDGFGYEAWRNCFELVNLNLREPKVREYLLDVIGFWIHEFDIDGIRLDCADCLEFSFMEEMRRFTNEKKADFWLMGEVIDQTGKDEHMKKREYAGRILLAAIAGVFLILAAFKRFSVNVVLSGSMEPALKTGGIIFTDTKKTMPGIGDIITYRMDDMLVTHRVTDKRDSAYITRGDANEGEDAAPVMQEQIVGTVVFFIPVLGYVAAFLKSKPVFGLISLMLIQELFFLGMQWKGVCRQFCTDRKYEKISKK